MSFVKATTGLGKGHFEISRWQKTEHISPCRLGVGDSATGPASFGRLPADGTVIASVSRAGTKHSLLIDVTECVSESSLF